MDIIYLPWKGRPWGTDALTKQSTEGIFCFGLLPTLVPSAVLESALRRAPLRAGPLSFSAGGVTPLQKSSPRISRSFGAVRHSRKGRRVGFTVYYIARWWEGVEIFQDPVYLCSISFFFFCLRIFVSSEIIEMLWLSYLWALWFQGWLVFLWCPPRI